MANDSNNIRSIPPLGGEGNPTFREINVPQEVSGEALAKGDSNQTLGYIDNYISEVNSEYQNRLKRRRNLVSGAATGGIKPSELNSFLKDKGLDKIEKPKELKEFEKIKIEMMGEIEEEGRRETRDIGKEGRVETKADVATNEVATSLFGKPWSQLSPAQQQVVLASQQTTSQRGKGGSPGERKRISEAQAQLLSIDNISKLFDPKYVGAVEGRIGKAKSATGIGLTESEAAFRSATKKMAADLRRFYFGTAQTATELKNSLEAIPDVNMSDVLFQASLKETKKSIERSLQTQGIPTGGQNQETEDIRRQEVETRGKELEAQGFNEAEIISQLEDEGY